MLWNYYGYYDYWRNYHKVTFDGPNKIIIVNPNVYELDVKIDLYSDWKEWMMGDDGLVNSKFLPAMTAIGGQPLPGDRFVGSTYFLINGWRIRPWTGDYRLIVNGNLYTEEGENPFLPALGDANVTIVQTVSTLVETIGIDTGSSVTPQEIAGAVWDETLSDHVSAGTTGEALDKIKKNSSLIPATV